MFRHIFVVAQTRQLDLKDVLSHLLGPIPWALAEKDGTLIMTASDTYGYRAYIEMLLSYGEDAKKSQLTSSLFYKDQSGRFEGTSLSGDQPANSGFVLRNELIKESRSVDMIGRIHADIFFQDRYIINGVNVKIKLIRSRDSFSLMGSGTVHKVVIKNAVLLIRKVKLNSSVFMAHAQTLDTTNAKCPVRRVI